MMIIRAGGGLVQNDYGEYLLMYRNGKWDLPKGHQDDGETLAKTALREVREECGVTELRIGKLIGCTWHSYWTFRQLIFKQTHWFYMYTPGRPALCPQVEEGIERCCWCPPNEVAQHLLQSYPSVRWLFHRAIGETI